MNPLDKAIECLGGVGKLASAIGVGQPVVSNWRARGTIPDAITCLAIERATAGEVTRQDLRPEDFWRIWPDLAHLTPAVTATDTGNPEHAGKGA